MENQINRYAMQLIRRKAYQLVGRFGFMESDIEDIQQELILDLLSRFPNYNTKKSRKNSFINGVVENKVATMIEARRTQKRQNAENECSLNEMVEDKDGDEDDGVRVERGKTIELDDYLIRTGRISRPLSELLEMELDFRWFIENLPEDLSEICQWLKQCHISEISRSTGISRGTIYDAVKMIAILLEEKGLKDYHH